MAYPPVHVKCPLLERSASIKERKGAPQVASRWAVGAPKVAREKDRRPQAAEETRQLPAAHP